MRVVVTGASGFIGRNVLLRLPREWDVTATYHTTTDLPSFVARHQLRHVRAVACNLLDRDAVRALAGSLGHADAVLYLAANGDPALSADRPRFDLEANTTALVTFLEQVQAEHVVYVSSGAVYDGLVGEVSPATLLAPRLPYAIAKLASELYVRFFCERRGTIGSYINVRFFGAYGPYEAGRKITTRWLRAMSEGQRTFVIRGDGKNLIDFMYIDDAVSGLLALLSARGASTTLDFASGSPVSIDDVVLAMARALGVDVALTHEGEVHEYIKFRSVDPTMRERFGVAPAIAFDEGFARFQRFFREQAHVAG